MRGLPPPTHGIPLDMVNKQAVYIPLQCIVLAKFPPRDQHEKKTVFQDAYCLLANHTWGEGGYSPGWGMVLEVWPCRGGYGPGGTASDRGYSPRVGVTGTRDTPDGQTHVNLNLPATSFTGEIERIWTERGHILGAPLRSATAFRTVTQQETKLYIILQIIFTTYLAVPVLSRDPF